MEWITTAAAAERLEVSTIRVRQFIQKGRLKVQPFGRVWLVSAESVERFKSVERPKGRPKQAAPSAPTPKRKRPGK